ncbi:DNA-processing protein DprA [Ornithinibacillus bavariensis]|uniref:DNA processing protein DprA n=1 Tax=Ornithinibacillus bavariensis TaxID=545502 RepID=A0A920C6I2_9BACI|nr:DNA-processing protein DprA [Ornithinibacillus bavariensis]GIO26139.1 DNA processing protein DprA [Ornithinibacillus bavariensis]
MLINRKIRLIHLHRCRGISRQKLRRLLQIDPSLKNVFQLSSSQLSRYLSTNQEKSELLYQDLHNEEIIQDIYRDQKRYSIITILDDNYPPMLKAIKDAPIVLYAAGNLSLLTSAPLLSVIGTRKPSPLAYPNMKFIVTPLVQQKWVIVSGMARGIDSYAHRLALLHKGKTIAVLGSGFHHVYPQENSMLFKHITQNGLAISEYPPNVRPKPYHFPERNRIISGLSFGTLVIEATEKSGTLITVDQALDQGREVYAVPGPPYILESKGCLQLIQDGAKLVQTYEDIFLDWEILKDNWYHITGILK